MVRQLFGSRWLARRSTARHRRRETSIARPGTQLGSLAYAGASFETLEGRALLATFSPGNLVIERIGDGATALGSTAAAVAVLEVNPSGTVVQTLTSQFTGDNLLTDSGTATSNGYVGVNGQYLAVAGYNAAVGTASVTSQNNKVTNIVGTNAEVASRTLFPTGGPTGTPPSPFSGNNIRSVLPTGTNTFYAAGNSSGTPNTGGIWYFDGAAFTQVSSTAASPVSVQNMRNVEIYNGQLYFSSAAGAFVGISALGTGLPTSAGTLPTLAISPGAAAQPYGFVLFSTGSLGAGVLDLAYIADDRATTGGGLQKWVFDGSAWSNAWSLLVGGTTNGLSATTAAGFAGLRGLTGTYDPALGAALYATTTETSNNRLISILDAGTPPTTFTTLQSAGVNYVFRGTDVSPAVVPEPSAFILVGMGVAPALVLAGRRVRRRSRRDGTAT